MRALTVEQRRLARHALGLPNDTRRSYRNRFYVGPKTPSWLAWTSMVDDGRAVFYAAEDGQTSDLFILTRSGAEAALDPGETLDVEDFPSLQQGGAEQ